MRMSLACLIMCAHCKERCMEYTHTPLEWEYVYVDVYTTCTPKRAEMRQNMKQRTKHNGARVSPCALRHELTAPCARTPHGPHG